MALMALFALLIAAFAGLAAGRWRALLPVVPAVPLCALLAGPIAGAVAALTVVGAQGVGGVAREQEVVDELAALCADPGADRLVEEAALLLGQHEVRDQRARGLARTTCHRARSRRDR